MPPRNTLAPASMARTAATILPGHTQYQGAPVTFPRPVGRDQLTRIAPKGRRPADEHWADVIPDSWLVDRTPPQPPIDQIDEDLRDNRLRFLLLGIVSFLFSLSPIVTTLLLS